MVLFACDMSEKRKCSKKSLLGQVHAPLATMSRIWLPIWQTSSLALHRTLLDILNSSTSFCLTVLAGLTHPADAMLHLDTFLFVESQKKIVFPSKHKQATVSSVQTWAHHKTGMRSEGSDVK